MEILTDGGSEKTKPIQTQSFDELRTSLSPRENNLSPREDNPSIPIHTCGGARMARLINRASPVAGP